MPANCLPPYKKFEDDGLDRRFLDEYDDPDSNGICALLRPRWISNDCVEVVRGRVNRNLNGKKMSGKKVAKKSSIVVPEEAYEDIMSHEDDIDYSNPNVKTKAEISSHIDRFGGF